MKRVLAILISLSLIFTMTACGGSSGGGESSGGGTQSSAKSKATIEETVLVDEGGVKITATSFDPEAVLGPELKLHLENNSGKDLTIDSSLVEVNGYMITGLLGADVENGKQVDSEINFLPLGLGRTGITEFADMKITFRMYDMETLEDYLITDPVELKTSIADSYDRTFDDSGDVIYDENGFKFVKKGFVEDDPYDDPGILLYVENNTEDAVLIHSVDVKVNGESVDETFSCPMSAGAHAIAAMTFEAQDFENLGIEEIKEVELNFHIVEWENWDTILDTPILKITF